MWQRPICVYSSGSAFLCPIVKFAKQLPLAIYIQLPYRWWNMGTNIKELGTLKNILTQADLILATAPALPENRTGACRELLSTALALCDDLLKESKAITPAALLGSKGGSETAKRHGVEHYRNMAASRKTRGGGRPRKSGESSSKSE